MRVAKITTLYPAYIETFYGERPHLEHASYAEQSDAIGFDGFGWADYWAHALAPLGYDLHEIRANVEPLQRAWLAEHTGAGAALDEDWVHTVPLAQLGAIAPDVLFMDEYTTFPAEWIEAARRAVPSIRLVIGWCGAPFLDGSVFGAYDAVLSNIPELVRWFTEHGHRAYHVNHAFDPRILTRIPEERVPDIDISFIGQISRARNAHGERERLLSLLARRADLHVYSPVERSTPRGMARARAKQLLFRASGAAHRVGLGSAFARIPVVGRAAAWTEPPVAPIGGPLGRAVRPPVFGLHMFKTLRRSRLTLNSHIDLSRRAATNMRMFESTGVGTCLLTDAKGDLPSLFAPDSEVVTYGSPAECVERAEWLLARTAEREAIARAGQSRTLREHTFAQRAPEVDAIIRRELR